MICECNLRLPLLACFGIWQKFRPLTRHSRLLFNSWYVKFGHFATFVGTRFRLALISPNTCLHINIANWSHLNSSWALNIGIQTLEEGFWRTSNVEKVIADWTREGRERKHLAFNYLEYPIPPLLYRYQGVNEVLCDCQLSEQRNDPQCVIPSVRGNLNSQLTSFQQQQGLQFALILASQW